MCKCAPQEKRYTKTQQIKLFLSQVRGSLLIRCSVKEERHSGTGIGQVESGRYRSH